MGIKKVAVATVITAGIVLGGTACSGIGSSGPNANQQESQAQAQDSQNMINNQPVPVYQSSQMRAALIDIQDLEANGENTTSFFFNQGVTHPVNQCASRGMPIPASAELTNPFQVQWKGGSYGNASAVTGQMDPTGIYTGDTTGTNVVCVDNQGKMYLQYWEGFVDTISGPATWNNTTQSIQLLGPPDTLKNLQK